MTAQRWFLTTSAQYAAAPVGTQVLPYEGADYWIERDDHGWFASDMPEQRFTTLLRPREVKRWGTDADHARACEAMRRLNDWLSIPQWERDVISESSQAAAEEAERDYTMKLIEAGDLQGLLAMWPGLSAWPWRVRPDVTQVATWNNESES